MNPDLDKEMSFWVKLLGLDKPDPISGKPWKVSWGWVDSIDLGDGRQAYGLNTVNGETQESKIDIRKLYTEKDRTEFVDTCAHEAAHCIGARMETLLVEGKQNEAHEYLAERLAPALVALRDSPKAYALAKAIQQWPKRAMALAKAATLPARAKEKTNMPEDIASLEKAMIEARLAGDAAKVQELFDKWLAAKVAANSGAPASDAAPAAAKPPEAAPAKPEDATPSNDAGMRDDEMAKRFKKETDAGIAVLLEARPDISDAQREYVKNECKSIAGAAAYLKTIPLAKPQEGPKAPEQLGNPKPPRGGAGGSNTVAPSGDAKVNALFRIRPNDPESDGVTMHNAQADGKLVSFSVVGAFAKIKESTNKMVEQQRMKMFGGAQ